MPKDKLLHFIAGFAASLTGAACWFLSGSPAAVLPWFVFLASGVAGLTKEAADWMDNRIRPGSHGVEFWDFVVTLAGAVPVVIVINLVHHLI
jgi:hypothetical protein